MIEAKNVYKRFGTLEVLKGVSLTVNDGEIVSIVGPSGAGKTTLLQLLGTLDRSDAGEIVYDGCNVQQLSARQQAVFRNRNIGFVFQFHQLLPEFTALENVSIPALIAGEGKLKAEERAMEILRLLRLEDRAHHKPSELSGGENQRVAVARALINHPKVVLADEPSGSLDSHNKAELHHLFFDLRDRLGQTFIIVTHDKELASLTDRTLEMRDGLMV